MKFCNKCGEPLIPGTKFCNKCGNKIEEKESQKPETTEVSEIIINTPKPETVEICDINPTDVETSTEDSSEISSVDTESLGNTTTGSSIDENINSEDFASNEDTINDKDIANNEDITNIDIDVDEDDTTSEPCDSPKKKKSKKALFIAIPIVLILVGISAFLYFSKDSLLYDYYYNKATEETSTAMKLEEYNKALKYDYSTVVIDDVFKLLQNDSYFESEINSMTNLTKVDKSKLITKICLANANNFVNSKNYEAALSSLKTASKYGYDITTYPNYKVIENGLKADDSKSSDLDPKYSFKNSNPSADPKDIYKYSDDYIIYSSDDTYLTKAELSEYNKEALALIRNEIYARHGYVFQTEPFKSYFNSKDWYQPNPSFKGNEGELNEYERANVNLILEMEKNK